jgi:hypothetical protein
MRPDMCRQPHAGVERCPRHPRHRHTCADTALGRRVTAALPPLGLSARELAGATGVQRGSGETSHRLAAGRAPGARGFTPGSHGAETVDKRRQVEQLPPAATARGEVLVTRHGQRGLLVLDRCAQSRRRVLSGMATGWCPRTATRGNRRLQSKVHGSTICDGNTGVGDNGPAVGELAVLAEGSGRRRASHHHRARNRPSVLADSS